MTSVNREMPNQGAACREGLFSPLSNSSSPSCRLNWEEKDNDFERLDIFTNYVYMEGLGFYGFGAAHLIGGLAQGSTMLLRQTIDGQTLSNFPDGLRVKGFYQFIRQHNETLKGSYDLQETP